MVGPRILSGGCSVPSSRFPGYSSAQHHFFTSARASAGASRLPAVSRSVPSTSSAFSTSSPSSRPTSSKQQWKPPAPSASAYQKQSRREWVLVGVAGSAAAVGSWYYWSNIRPRHQAAKKATSDTRPFSLTADVRTSFSIPTRNAQVGGPTAKVIMTLPASEVDRRLVENERSTRVDRPAGACLVARYDTNSVASNDPIEDKRAEVIVERDRGVAECDSPKDISGSKGAATALGATVGAEEVQAQAAAQSAKGDLCFFAVMDGHAGYHTSTLLSQKLIAFVALELDKVFREAGEYGEIAKAKAAMPSKLWRSLFGGPADAASAGGGLDGDPEVIKRAIAKAFRGLDKEIVNTPVELLKEYELSLAATSSSSSSPANPSRTTGGTGTRSLSSLAHSIFPLSSNAAFTATQKSAYESILPALSGSCALLTYVDSARQDIYVACTGDSRAIAGYWDEQAGKWEVEALSIDQTGRNPDEVRRMKSEHPASESEHVVMRGRVLGGLEPTRAFGDARYKWDRDLQGRLYDAFLPGGRASTRGPPRGLETPPYVTATPVVEWRRVGESSSSPSRELRFIVMATDGLWDMISNEEVGGLVAGHLAGVKGTILATELHRQCFEAAQRRDQPLASIASATPEQQQQLADAKQHPLSRGPDHLKAFTFQDDNLSTHLIRNALGGANQQRVAGLLAIPSPESRRYRDDITVNVILFNSAHAAAAAATATGAVADGTASRRPSVAGGPDAASGDGKPATPQGASLPNVPLHGSNGAVKAKL